MKRFCIFVFGICVVLFGSRVSADPNAPINLTVDATQTQHIIEENIYGVNLATPEQIALWQVPISRYGGNPQSRYNWEIAVWNTGDHFFFENINDPDPGTLPVGSQSDNFVRQNITGGAESVIQLPLMGWVPKDRTETCGYHWDKYGWQTEADWWFHWGCGSGIQLYEDANGVVQQQPITWNDPADTSIQVDETFSQRWIQHLQSQFGADGVKYYALGNEPMIWGKNHGDVHKETSTYDYVTEKGVRYAKAVKATDSNALTMGPGVWGFQPMIYSGWDIEQYWETGTFPDYNAHGQKPFLAWYLQEMAAESADVGHRLLDYVDVHYYPQVYVGDTLLALSDAGDDNAQALRLRSTRELWDRNWVAESWINQEVYVIPRIHDWIDAEFPDTKIAITEYSWGANEHINGALAQADVLGIFGRENLHSAFLFDPPTTGQPVDYAMRMYRNYDGQGATFGELSLAATSSNEFDVAIFATRRAEDGAYTLMVINKTKQPQDISLQLSGIIETVATPFRYSAANLNAIVQLPDAVIDNGNLATTLPQESITLYVLGGTTNPTAVALSHSGTTTSSIGLPLLAVLMVGMGTIVVRRR